MECREGLNTEARATAKIARVRGRGHGGLLCFDRHSAIPLAVTGVSVLVLRRRRGVKGAVGARSISSLPTSGFFLGFFLHESSHRQKRLVSLRDR